MKFIILLTILNINLSCNNKISANKNEIEQKTETTLVDSLEKKKNIIEITNNQVIPIKEQEIKQDNSYFEDSIEIAISQMFKEKKIDFVDSKLNDIYKDEKIPKKYKAYWTTYLYYYKSIFYKGNLKDNKKASEFIDKAIELIEKDLTSSEDYALYASCLSFSIQFANMTQLASISSSVSENAEKALSLNNKNIRAYYVLTSNNFYTPKMFGGMTKVEEYAKKGLACPNSLENENYYAPYWGKPRIYELLINYYKAENKLKKADETKNLAKKEFSNLF
tara:strand:+ start:2967 stop:3800 length:834 start_codon:yes stop_codon:yes gene_type:complete